MTDRVIYDDPAVKPLTREPSIIDVGLEARKIDPAAFVEDISRSAPDRQKWIDRRAAALFKARAKLESCDSVDKTEEAP